MNEFTRKESPFMTLTGMGGGNSSRLLGAITAAIGNRSLRFNDGDSAYLGRTPSSTGNRRTWTWSAWIKRSGLAAVSNSYNALWSTGTDGNNYSTLYIDNNDQLFLQEYTDSTDFQFKVGPPLRDVSAWYHIVVAFDSTQSTATNRMKIYINGVQQDSTGTRVDPSQNYESMFNLTNGHSLGRNHAYNNFFFSGYITDVHFIDGSQLAPTSFGATDSNGVWQRSTYSGSYGTNGYHILDFANNSTIGNDTSGQGNTYTANNFSTTAGSGNDLLLDFPTNDTENTDSGAGGEVTGNYATWSPLVAQTSGSITLSNGNLDTTCGSTRTTAMSSFPLTGKTYWEVTFGSGTYNYIGMTEATGFNTVANNNSGIKYTGYKDYSYGWQQTDGKLYNASNIIGSPGGYSNGDVLGWAYDADNNTLKLYKNGNLEHTETGIADAQYYPSITHSGTATASTNFGQREFAYAAPSGYKAVCTTSLATPGVADGSDYFDQILYVGNQTARSITGLSFSPDLVIVKNRERSAYNHYWVDNVRGGAKNLYSNSSESEHNADRITTLDSAGFTLSSHMGPNYSGEDYIAHCWDAGTSTVTNNDGNRTSDVRASASSGFSIVSWTGNRSSGTTLGHGLSSTPEFMLVKNRNISSNWMVYHKGASKSGYLGLNLTAGYTSASSVWDNTAPTSSVFTVGQDSESNGNGNSMIAYVFAPVAGFSAAPSWVGNGSNDGTFIPLDFRPKSFWFKRTDGSANWYVYDSTRDTVNPVNKNLEWNTGDQENTLSSMKVDFLSNGIKIRGSDGDINASGGTYVGFAWAENPFQANGGLAR